MTKPFMFEKPLGMRDTLPLLYDTKQKIRAAVAEEMRLWGYQFVDTPTLEFYDTIGAASAILERQLFKLLDQQGHTVVLRPDLTAPIARIAASRLRDECYPFRLAYDASVFRSQQREGGRPAEFEQIGIELIGDATLSADAEVISLMIAVMKKAGLADFTMALGHIGYVNALFLEVLGKEERAENLRRHLYEKNYVGYREHVRSLGLSSIDEKKLLMLLDLRGGSETLKQAEDLVNSAEGKQAAAELGQLWSLLENDAATAPLKIDLNLISHMSYYTGITFEGYSGRVGYPLCNGGRYDNLMEKFERPAKATGFGVRLDRLVEALGTIAEQEEGHCILFSAEQRSEALAAAKKARQSGQRIVLQELKGVDDVDAFTKQFSAVTYLLGNGNGGSGDEW